MVSAPAPPFSVSLPPPPISVSLPVPPIIALANSLPVSVRVCPDVRPKDLDLGKRGEGVADGGEDGVVALADGFGHHVAGVVDEVGVVSDTASIVSAPAPPFSGSLPAHRSGCRCRALPVIVSLPAPPVTFSIVFSASVSVPIFA